MNIKQSILLIMLFAVAGTMAMAAKYPNTSVGTNKANADAMALLKQDIFGDTELTGVTNIINLLKSRKQNLIAANLEKALYRKIAAGKERDIETLKEGIRARAGQLAGREEEYAELENKYREKLAQAEESAARANDLMQERDSLQRELADATSKGDTAAIDKLKQDNLDLQVQITRAATEQAQAKQALELAKATAAEVERKFNEERQRALDAFTEQINDIVNHSKQLASDIGKLLGDDATRAATLPILLSSTKESLDVVALRAQDDKKLQTALLNEANNHQSSVKDYARWIIINAAQGGHKWAEDALVKNTHLVKNGTIEVPALHEWSRDAIVLMSPQYDWAFKKVVALLDHNDNEPALQTFAKVQADKGNANFAKYLVEKAVYAAWNYDSKLGTDYGTWVLCILKNSSAAGRAWARDAIKAMASEQLEMFNDLHYKFTSEKIRGAIRNKNSEKTYIDQARAWAVNPNYKCSYTPNNAYAGKKLPAQPKTGRYKVPKRPDYIPEDTSKPVASPSEPAEESEMPEPVAEPVASPSEPAEESETPEPIGGNPFSD